jgi:hypothetical protein
LVIAPPPINDVANLPLNKRCRIYARCTCFAEQPEESAEEYCLAAVGIVVILIPWRLRERNTSDNLSWTAEARMRVLARRSS